MTSSATGTTFADLGLDPRIASVLSQLGYEEPTPVQSSTIPALLEGRDVLGQAATGTGKTAAFALPLLHRHFAEVKGRGTVSVLVLVPTRELAMQVAEAMHKYGKGLRLQVLPIYGGQPIGTQLRALQRGVDVVVATPGRALDHVNRGTLDLDEVRAVVLDEADEMLDMGFAEDLEAILGSVPEERQTALFSATMPSRLNAIASRHMKNPVKIRIAEDAGKKGSVAKVRQVAYVLSRSQKVEALGRVLDLESPTSCLVFCRTRNEVDQLSETLMGRGYRAEALHGGLNQSQRDKVMKRLREGRSDLLLATDVAARGLDIEHLSHVVNYDMPSAPESYVHRIGRTGRAGREGVAITFVEPRERFLLKNVEKLVGRPIEIARLPTLADLRARRLELVRASVREALVAGQLDGVRGIVESLADEFEPLDIAAAAIHLLQEASDRDGQASAPDAPSTPAPSAGKPRPERAERPDRAERARSDAPPSRPERPARPREREESQPSGEFVRLFVSAGREAGVRPGDLVGAITAEAGVGGKTVGAIEIADRYSLVEVRSSEAERIMEALRRTALRGQRITVSRYQPKKK
jgi:ATP-dependent RNA helicase DeaD